MDLSWAAALAAAGIIGGLFATLARVLPFVNNKLVPVIAVAATTLANVWLVVQKFLDAAGIPTAWMQWAPPSDGEAMAYAGWSLSGLLQIAIAVLVAIKAQFPLQRLSFENGEAALLYPNRVVPVPVEMASVQTGSVAKGRAKA